MLLALRARQGAALSFEVGVELADGIFEVGFEIAVGANGGEGGSDPS